MPARAVLVVALLLAAVPAPAVAATDARVTATRETPALFDDEQGGDADADDPAVWVDRHRPGRSLVIGTAKNAGLRVYDLGGRQSQSIPAPPAPDPDSEPGRFNNVDLAYGVKLDAPTTNGAPTINGPRATKGASITDGAPTTDGPGTADLAIVTDRGRDKLRIYRIDPVARQLVDVTAPDAPFLFSRDQGEVNDATTGYGLATYTRDGIAYAVVSRRHTSRLGLFRLKAYKTHVTYEKLDTLDLPSTFRLPNGTSWTPCDEPGVGPQVEGMAVDGGTLYAAQEDVALWRLTIRGNRLGAPSIVDKVREYGVPATYDPETDECTLDWSRDPGYGGTRISADVEGLTVYDAGHGRGYLLVSSQGDSTFLLYDGRSNRFLSRFTVADGAVDGAQHSDGAAVVSVPVGPAYPRGLLVVHDGENTGPDAPRASTNFKYVDWRVVQREVSW
jgi:3-phytase